MKIDYNKFKAYAIADSNSVTKDNPLVTNKNNVTFDFTVNSLISKDEKLVQVDNCKKITSEVTRNIRSHIKKLRIFGYDEVESNAFEECNVLTDVDFDDSIKKINIESFNTCRKLSAITGGINIESIGSYAFYRTSIDNVFLPKLKETDTRAFGDNSNLKHILLPIINKVGGWTFAYTSISNIDLSNANIIENNAFSHCENLTSINIPKITIINHGVFEECHSLPILRMENIESIENNAFYNCSSLHNVEFNNSFYIGVKAFYNCNALSSLSISSAITIDCEAFSKCSSLKKIYLPNINKIESKSFANTSDLSLYYRYINDVDWNTIETYPLEIKDMSFGTKDFPMSGDWAFILPPKSYLAVRNAIKNDVDNINSTLKEYRKYINIDWVPGDPWGTHTNPKFKNEDGSIKEQHIITILKNDIPIDLESNYNLEIKLNRNKSTIQNESYDINSIEISNGNDVGIIAVTGDDEAFPDPITPPVPDYPEVNPPAFNENDKYKNSYSLIRMFELPVYDDIYYMSGSKENIYPDALKIDIQTINKPALINSNVSVEILCE